MSDYNKIANLEEENAKLRALVGELADALVAIGIKCDDESAAMRISQAQRIVAELAKVSGGYWTNVCNGHLAYCCNSGSKAVQCCIGKCREIAEEQS